MKEDYYCCNGGSTPWCSIQKNVYEPSTEIKPGSSRKYGTSSSSSDCSDDVIEENLNDDEVYNWLACDTVQGLQQNENHAGRRWIVGRQRGENFVLRFITN